MVKDHDFGKMSLFRQSHFGAISGGFRRERAEKNVAFVEMQFLI